MANDFTGDADCMALWRFENGALVTDTIGGNTLTPINSPVADVGDFKEGLASVDLELGDQDSFYINDVDLDANFPLKNLDANKKISVCFWVKFESLPGGAWKVVIGKMSSGKRSFAIAVNLTPEFVFALGIPPGTNWEFENHGTGIVVGRWYHVGFTYQDSDKSYKMRIWDDTAKALLGGAEVTGNTANNINVEDALLQIGAGYFVAVQEWVDGLIDEVVVFKDILSSAEIDAIRKGNYPILGNDFSGDADCMALYKFESGALTTDSKGGNTLTNNGAVAEDLVNFREGFCAADFTPNDWFHRTDAGLDADFPLKNGDATKEISVCYWVQLDATTAYSLLVGKYDTANKRSFASWLMLSGVMRFAMTIGTPGGVVTESKQDTTVAVGTGKWYHVGMTFKNSDKSFRIRIWDEDAGTVTETTGNFTNNIGTTTADFEIGRYTTGGYLNARLDEVAVFKDILTAAEIDEIRQGIYGAGAAAPTVTTQAVSNIAATTATGNGTITATGGEACHTRGICWSINPNPTTADDKAEDDGGGAYGVGAFAKAMTGLTPGQHYHVRAYAINSIDTSYGADVEFDALVSAVVIDIQYLTPTTGYVWYQRLAGANFADDDVLDNGGGDEITVNGTPAADPTFYEQGEIEMTSGDNDGQQRPIALDAAGVITALWPFVTAVGIGDTYKVYPGCDLRGITCHHKFHNENTFRGYLYVPRTEDALM